MGSQDIGILQIVENCRILIANGKTEKALTELVSFKKRKFRNRSINLSNQYKTYKSQYQSGFLTHEEFSSKVAKLNDTLLNFLQDIESKSDKNSPSTFKRNNLLNQGIFLVLGILSFFLAFNLLGLKSTPEGEAKIDQEITEKKIASPPPQEGDIVLVQFAINQLECLYRKKTYETFFGYKCSDINLERLEAEEVKVETLGNSDAYKYEIESKKLYPYFAGTTYRPLPDSVWIYEAMENFESGIISEKELVSRLKYGLVFLTDTEERRGLVSNLELDELLKNDYFFEMCQEQPKIFFQGEEEKVKSNERKLVTDSLLPKNIDELINIVPLVVRYRMGVEKTERKLDNPIFDFTFLNRGVGSSILTFITVNVLLSHGYLGSGTDSNSSGIIEVADRYSFTVFDQECDLYRESLDEYYDSIIGYYEDDTLLNVNEIIELFDLPQRNNEIDNKFEKDVIPPLLIKSQEPLRIQVELAPPPYYWDLRVYTLEIVFHFQNGNSVNSGIFAIEM